MRTCTATCQGDLCNDFDDVFDRVQAAEKEAAEQTPAWVIPVAVVVPLVVIGLLVGLGVSKVQANRRKARGLRTP